MALINTSYDQRYVIVSKDATSVTLRPIEGSFLQTYWQEFLEARAVLSKEPVGPITIRLRQAPPEVLRVDAYTALHIEYPRVAAICDGVETDISDLVTSNKPNTDVPGLYAISYQLPLPGEPENEIWRSYVSIEEPPVLRQVITPWNRGSYTIATLNRLLIEPQFQEALYEEGAPLYNFVTSNTSPALRCGDLPKLKGAACAKLGRNLFISGPKVPSSSRVILEPAHGAEYEVHVDRTITVQQWGAKAYPEGDLVQQGAYVYFALSATVAEDIPGSSSKWVAGHAYRLEEELEEGPDAEAWEREPDGVLLPKALWVWVDLRGYVFDVDALHAPALGTYWGYYDAKNFYDYAPGDLVSYISDGVLYIYRRNDTDIQDLSTEEAYRPGDFHNPHWEEAYAAYVGGQIRDFRRYLAPVTNAANGVVVKTGSLSELSCRLYAYMMGIPDSIVDFIGSKCSVFLYILLQRTRNTFEGFRNAFRAIGMDVEDLHRVYSTVETVDGDGVPYPSVYKEAEALKKVAQSIRAGKLFHDGIPSSAITDVDPEDPDSLPWVRYYPDPATAMATKHHGPYAIQEYRGGAWTTVYEIEGFGDSYPQGLDRIRGNNRYYKCAVTLLSRLAKNAIADLHDGRQWIDLNSYAPVSRPITDICDYEVPMYIYLRAKVLLASICYATRQGVASIRLHRDSYGGTPVLVLHPFRYLDLSTGMVTSVYPTLQVYNGLGFEDREPDEMRGDARAYIFGHKTRVKFQMPNGYSWSFSDPCWTSRHTLGLLGDGSEEPPVDASALQPRDNELICEICNGIVGATMIAGVGTLAADFEYLAWNYILHRQEIVADIWKLDETTPFASFKAGECEVFSTWTAGVTALLTAYALDENGEAVDATFHAVSGGSGVCMEIVGRCPKMIYIYSSDGRPLASVRIPEQRSEGPAECEGQVVAKITFGVA